MCMCMCLGRMPVRVSVLMPKALITLLTLLFVLSMQTGAPFVYQPEIEKGEVIDGLGDSAIDFGNEM